MTGRDSVLWWVGVGGVAMPSHFLRVYPDRRSALRASVFLMEEGLLARPQDVPVGAMPRVGREGPRYEHWVVLAFAGDLEHGAALLREFEALPAVRESESDPEVEPDLSRLPTALTIPCGSCRYDLRALVRSAAPVTCPECGVSNDPIERILARHGPEALLDCYPDEEPEDPEWTEEAVIRRLQLPCPHCGYALHDLEPIGACPACGRAYNKRAIVRHAFDAM